MDSKKLLLFLATAKKAGHSEEDIQKFIMMRALMSRGQQGGQGGQGGQEGTDFLGKMLNVPKDVLSKITQRFGQRSKYDVFSGGVNYGVDFGIGEGTPISAPSGNWEVKESYGGAKGRGRIGNKTNSGYGNSVVLQNQDTGEQIRLSHLAQAIARQGQKVQGGQRVGISGATGNVTGPHLDVEYRDQKGKLSDVLRTKYAQEIFR